MPQRQQVVRRRHRVVRSAGNRAVEQVGTCGEARYEIRRSGEKWRVLRKRAGKTATLADGVSYAQSYRVAVDDCRKAAS